MRRAGRSSFVVIVAAAWVLASCFEVAPPPPPVKAPAGKISGRVLLGDARGAAALERDAMERVRRELTEARRGERAVASRPQPPLQVTGAHDERVRPDAVAGDAVVFFERHAFTKASLSRAVTTMTRAIGLPKVRNEVVTCAGGIFCRVHLFDDDGFLDERATADAIAAMNKARAPGVRFIARNTIHQGFRVPNDTLFPLQWHYDQIKLPPAWDLSIGSPDLVVAVVDSGVKRGNPDLRDSLARDPQNSNQFVEMDFVSAEFSGDGDGPDLSAEDPGDNLNGSDEGEDSYHGTHIAGTIGAETDNGSGVAGVLWDVQVVPVRVLGTGLQGTISDILAGLFWAVGDPETEQPKNQRPAKIVNLSLGADTDEETQAAWQAVVDEILEDPTGVYPQKPILVVAAGNNGVNARTVVPANIDRLITVGASQFDGLRAEYSNFGEKIDLLAPGGATGLDLNNDQNPDGVLSTWDNDVKFEQGTSMSAPHVVGVAGLIVAVKPELTHDDVHQILKDTAAPQFICNEGCGAGLLDAVRALLVAGVEARPEPVLAIETQTILFENGIASRNVRVFNLGSVAAPFALSLAGPDAGLFSLSPATGTIEPTDSLEVTITLARGGRASGIANLVVDGTGAASGQQVVAVVVFDDLPSQFLSEIEAIQVGAFLRTDDGDLQPVTSTTAIRADGFQFLLKGLEAGDYELRAVADDNNDGIFDSQAESVGAFPSISEPEAIAVAEDEHVTDIEFTVSPQFTINLDSGVGAPCTSETSAQDCVGIDFAPDAACIPFEPDGYCSRLCDDGRCGASAVCKEVRCGNEPCDVCLQRCTSTTQCRDGYACELNTCVPPGFFQ